MLKYIICFDEELKQKMILDGYMKVYENNKQCVFENNKTIKFNFENIDKTKYIYSNKFKMTF